MCSWWRFSQYRSDYEEVEPISERQRCPASDINRMSKDELLLTWQCVGHVIICDRARVRVRNNVNFKVIPGSPPARNIADYSRQMIVESIDNGHMSWDKGKVVVQDKATFSSTSFTFLNFTTFESEHVESVLDKDLAKRHHELFQQAFREWPQQPGLKPPQDLYVCEEMVVDIDNHASISLVETAGVTMTRDPDGCTLEIEFSKPNN